MTGTLLLLAALGAVDARRMVRAAGLDPRTLAGRTISSIRHEGSRLEMGFRNGAPSVELGAGDQQAVGAEPVLMVQEARGAGHMSLDALESLESGVQQGYRIVKEAAYTTRSVGPQRSGSARSLRLVLERAHDHGLKSVTVVCADVDEADGASVLRAHDIELHEAPAEQMA